MLKLAFYSPHRNLSVPAKRKHLTPGITRRPEPLLEFESRRVGGRVQAVPMQSQDSSDDTTPRQAHQ